MSTATLHRPIRYADTPMAATSTVTSPNATKPAARALDSRRRERYDATGPAGRRPGGSGAAASARVAGTRCAASAIDRRVVARRRATAAAVMLGGALALLVWVVAIIGSNYAASVQPAPTGTEIVHVRQGDSLSSIADRIAPEVPRQAVIEQIVERNRLADSGLRVGQALVAPAYS
ncbi:LysM peptidoglycan-binding domain-containing protein [Gordonia sp. HNM0687]|uniref:LysM peptidoglycan-binding domain-containing protein n=1 Tax=Gordonia mangrovi TaxID=2665643 RepID=A0A6L7GQY9_9ACTN|nr:LysM peptidoglycan-binding domain-containing protein [Gordonia mangrovi]MXP22364.1 LysM peptidoglycan-binding domain-containing protein [Gordonia mangrovi]UVF77748.1 LysM peptidoglycan-binding domain-containing protein [Gordonia mangrovi]